jgi:hypothetical protein
MGERSDRAVEPSFREPLDPGPRPDASDRSMVVNAKKTPIPRAASVLRLSLQLAFELVEEAPSVLGNELIGLDRIKPASCTCSRSA